MSSLCGVAMMSSPKFKNLRGDWKIKTVLVDDDTLFHADNAGYTARFYEKNMNVEDKSDTYHDYLTNCIKSTYANLTRVKLTINRRQYSHSLIMPCWDHIKHLEVNKGRYHFENDKLRLENSEMYLSYYRSPSTLIYKNQTYNYEITFRKLE